MFQCPNMGYFMLILLCNPMCDIVHSSMEFMMKAHTSNNVNLDWRRLRMSGYKNNGCWNKLNDPRMTPFEMSNTEFNKSLKKTG